MFEQNFVTLSAAVHVIIMSTSEKENSAENSRPTVLAFASSMHNNRRYNIRTVGHGIGGLFVTNSQQYNEQNQRYKQLEQQHQLQRQHNKISHNMLDAWINFLTFQRTKLFKFSASREPRQLALPLNIPLRAS